MDQMTFSGAEYQKKKRKTPREIFTGVDGQTDSLEAVGKERSPLLPQGPERSASLSTVCHAASSLHAAVL